MPAAPNPLPGPVEAPETPSFRLLGPVELRRGEELVNLGGPLQRTLMASLLLAVGEVVSRERLIDVLWEEDPPAHATRTLETKISRLRSALGPDTPLVARGGGYVLEVAARHVDVHRFHELMRDGASVATADPHGAKDCFARALRLWAGTALGGVPQELLSVERRRLEEERLEAIEARVDADLALGAGPELVSELEALHGAHPLREQFTERLMIALYRSGRQVEALQTYRTARRAAIDELGLEPGRRLRELEQAVLRHDEWLGPLPVRHRLARTARTPRTLAAVAAGGMALLILAVAIGFNRGHERVRPPPSGMVVLDGDTGSIRFSAPVGDSQGLTRFGYGFLWTLGENGVMSQIDPRSSKLVRSIPVGVQASDFAAGAGGIWVTDRNSDTLLRIDPVTGQIDARTHLSSRGLRHPQPNGGIASAAGSLWIARGSEAIDRRDPSTLHLQHRIFMRQGECGGAGCAVDAGDGRVWVAGGENGTLTAIDEATNHVLSQTRLRPFLCCVAVGGGSVWAAEAHAVAQLSPQGRVLRRVTVGRAGIADLAYDDGYLWAAADSTGNLVRIGARDGHIRITHVGNGLIGTAASKGTVAVAAVPPATNPTAGLGRKVLRIGIPLDWLNTTDPAVARSATGSGRWQWQMHHATCSQLYQQPDVNGPVDSPLQPELAMDMPRASTDGRTWTISLRSGARFSPPLNRPVKPEDVRASIVRALSPQLGLFAPAAHVLRDVVGVRAYRRGRATDVTGISVQGSHLVIQTRRRLDDLAARLALPYFCVLPAGYPTPPGGYSEPMPTAGPYYLAAHDAGTEAVLRRNPGYRGPRPQHLDALVFDIVDDHQGILDVQHGRLDYFTGSHTAVSRRVGCRVTLAHIPGLDLAALCRAPSHE